MSSFTVRENSTLYITGTIVNERGAGFVPETLTCLLYDKNSGAVINGRNRVNILNANGGTCSSGGSMTLTLTPNDNILVTAGSTKEKHVALLEFSWVDALGQEAKGSVDIEISVLDVSHVPAGINIATVTPPAYQLVDVLGGDRNAFALPPGVDEYPSGFQFNTLAPGTWPALLNATRLTAGNFYFECNARVSSAGDARVKAALFDLTNNPDAPIFGSEITFTLDEIAGEQKRSNAFTIPSTDALIGVKITVNSSTIDGAVWGCRIVRS